MATVVLQVVGAAIGGAIGGPAGAAIGRAIGAAAGYAVDQKLFAKDQIINAGRLENSRYLSSASGGSVPDLYGRARLSGQIIWATRFEEVRKKKKQGGKGGSTATVKTYTYYGNFAVGICEGPISHLGRIWADGKELDLTQINYRFYKGEADQQPDPFIEAKQGFGKVPGFRNTAYVVFERLPLSAYGNRIPQLSFEVIRSTSKVDRLIEAITIIPGATEFGYMPSKISKSIIGTSHLENRNTYVAGSDWKASIDELQALCPNLKSVSLVVSWFGDDLRASHCKIEPRVENHDSKRAGWQVAGLQRTDAKLTTQIDNKPAFGGTPSDASVLAAIADLKQRGLKVMLYPFVMMDIAPDNVLPDPYGKINQDAFPWRGRITCNPATGQPNSVDQTNAAKTQIDEFVGSAVASDFSVQGNEIVYSGQDIWSYRRMILHYSALCQLAGGVDAFLIGSELRGLTHIRDQNDEFPFVGQLKSLAAEVRSVLGPSVKLSYAADWSEYFGYHPQDASNDLYFHLDPLWSDPNIDAVSIDNYMPLSDWHEKGDREKSEQYSIHDKSYLAFNILGGEGYDWYYSNQQARLDGIRTPITDGQGEPWVWRYKDILSWWSNFHHERKNGQRNTNPTSWLPQQKPFWFTEAGCPAINRGTNQPNVFIDSKSSESALPYFSTGGRDDLIQSRYIETLLDFWSADAATSVTINPASNLYGGPMIATEDIWLWAWDARPFPMFPANLDLWSDGVNWHRGHWLNGRLGGVPLDDLISQILKDRGYSNAVVIADGFCDGYLVQGQASLRQILEPLVKLYNLSVQEIDGKLNIRSKEYCIASDLEKSNLLQENELPQLTISLASENSLPAEFHISHSDIFSTFETVGSKSRHLETLSERQVSAELPIVMSRNAAIGLAEARLRDIWAARETVEFSIPAQMLHLQAGDLFRINGGRLWQITSITQGLARQVQAIGFSQFEPTSPWLLPPMILDNAPLARGAPLVVLMNLPLKQDQLDPETGVYVAVSASPWLEEYAVLTSAAETGFELQASVSDPATIMFLEQALFNGPLGRWDWANTIDVTVPSGELQSVDQSQIFAGKNVIAVQTNQDEWELVQFLSAKLVGVKRWRLSGLLRGQMGTEQAAIFPVSMVAPIGAMAVFLDNSLAFVPIAKNQIGSILNWRTGPSDEDIASPNFDNRSFICSGASARPLSPVHLQAKYLSDEILISWIRRSRVNADSWEATETPLGEVSERYQVDFSDALGTVKRSLTVLQPGYTYSNSARSADFGDLQQSVFMSVSQLSEDGRVSPKAILQIN